MDMRWKIHERVLFRYYYAADNSTVFDQPFVLSNLNDIDVVADTLPDENLSEIILLDRPSTKYK